MVGLAALHMFEPTNLTWGLSYDEVGFFIDAVDFSVSMLRD